MTLLAMALCFFVAGLFAENAVHLSGTTEGTLNTLGAMFAAIIGFGFMAVLK